MNRIFGRVFNASKIIVTNHAKDRLLQRSRLLLRQHEKERPKEFIEKEFKLSQIDSKVIFSPFEQHKLETKHGLGSFKSYSKTFQFMGIYDSNTDTTIITSIFYYQKK